MNKTYTVTITQGLAIPPSLPQGTVGTIYHHTITVTGGVTPYARRSRPVRLLSRRTTGLIAADITINAGTRHGSHQRHADRGGDRDLHLDRRRRQAAAAWIHAFSITINAAPAIGSLSTTQWTAGQSGFTGVMTISGGTGPFSIASAGLPTGLTTVLNGSTISFSGRPTVAGAFAAGSVTVHDAAGATVSKPFSITINPAPTIGNLTATQWTVGMPASTAP